MNIELLIALVKERPILYDLRNPLYKDIRQKDRNWREICTALDVTMEVAKTKWKNLKDCYTRHLKRTKTTTGQASSRDYVHWQWAKHMEFMKPHLSFAPTLTNLSQVNQEAHVRGTQSSSDAQESSNVLETTSSSVTRSQGDTQRRRRRSSITPDENTSPNMDRLIQYFENKKKNCYDATELIFLGYAKSIKPFSIRRQARIKMKIANMIMDEEVAHFEETMLHRSSLQSSNDISDSLFSAHSPPPPQFNQRSPNYLLFQSTSTTGDSLFPNPNSQPYIPSQDANSTLDLQSDDSPNSLLDQLTNTTDNLLFPESNAQPYIPSQDSNNTLDSQSTDNQPTPNFVPSLVTNTTGLSTSNQQNIKKKSLKLFFSNFR